VGIGVELDIEGDGVVVVAGAELFEVEQAVKASATATAADPFSQVDVLMVLPSLSDSVLGAITYISQCR